jgi:protein-S-isoprenylcysteine O-methyltransferase Ste14
MNTLRFQNFFASSVFLLFFYFFYTQHPYFARYFAAHYFFFGVDVYVTTVFFVLVLVYLVGLGVLYFFDSTYTKSKSLIAWIALKKICFLQSIDKTEKIALLSILLKGFYAPLMVAWFIGHSADMLFHLSYVYQHANLMISDFRSIFQSHLYWLIFKIILFFDVLFFTLGYLIELPCLQNSIKSVETSVLGWAVALACYPPFNDVTLKLFAWHSTDFPNFSNSWLFYFFSFLLLFCMGVYSWASWSLGLKASNLTHRGIISTGAYAFVRHPAYFFKNLAWWVGGIPAILAGFSRDFSDGFFIVFCLAGWSTLYFLRAITEERHLMSVDDDYLLYSQKVRYRFIPFVI